MKQIQPLTNSQQRKCERSFLSQLFASSLWKSSLLALTNKLRRLLARVSMATTAFRPVKKTAPTGHRVLVGLLLVGCGPLLKKVYLLLEWTITPGAYFDPYYYFHAVGGDMTAVMCGTGFFLLLRGEGRLRYIALFMVPESIVRIIWMAFVDSNAEYHSFTPVSSLLWALSVAAVWFILFDWLTSRHFHKAWGSIARMDGMLKLTPQDIPNRDEKLANELETLKILLR